MTLHCESENEFLALLKTKVRAGKALTTDRFLTIRDEDVTVAVYAPERDDEI